jgi:uncharacterized protein RhaS with RHS repeats
MQQRYYDPLAGRFLSVDPVTTDEHTGGHFNRYVYGENNPYKYVDPDGRAPKPPSGSAPTPSHPDPVLGRAQAVVNAAGTIARTLAKSAETGGRAAKTEVHHTVPQTDKRAAEARDVMKSHGIDPKTESTNKVPLPGDKHDITKRDSYVRDTNQRVAAQPNADAVKAECCKIADNLQKSTVDELNKQYPAKK